VSKAPFICFAPDGLRSNLNTWRRCLLGRVYSSHLITHIYTHTSIHPYIHTCMCTSQPESHLGRAGIRGGTLSTTYSTIQVHIPTPHPRPRIRLDYLPCFLYGAVIFSLSFPRVDPVQFIHSIDLSIHPSHLSLWTFPWSVLYRFDFRLGNRKASQSLKIPQSKRITSG
jgi:hypothetical protein